jgi:hypothetical protein
MKNKNYILTKSKITSGLQCEKRLWFDFHDPIDRDNYLFHIGNRFGEVVRKYYGDGVDLSINRFNIDLALSDTREAIKDEKVKVIYEGAFVYSDTLVRTDVMLRKNSGWELLEAKSSTKLKDEYIDDIAIQSYIIKSLKIKVNSIKLIHIDNQFTYQGDKEYADLINDDNDITDKVSFKEKIVQTYIDKFKPIANENYSRPKIETGDHCLKPHKCVYLARCNNLKQFSNITPISILPREGKKLEKKYKDREITDLKDIPYSELNESQRIIQRVHKDNKPYINPNVGKIFKEFKWPFYFMDFETVTQGVPIIKGTEAYYPLPFQWSVHKWVSPNAKISDGKSFLDFSDQNIERKFIESLLNAIGSEGTVFAHHASTEIKVLEKLKDKDSCKDLSEKIDNLISRIVDTLSIVKNNFYASAMNGDYDLKKIIKAIPSDISYEEKDNISGGTEAQLAWFIYTDPKTSNDNKNKQIKLLKEYCAKDTLAIYYLIKYLLEQCNNTPISS